MNGALLERHAVPHDYERECGMTSQQNRTTLRTTRSAGRTGLGTLLFTALFGAAACTGAPPDAADPIAEDPAAVGQVALEAGNIAGWDALGATSAPGHIRRLIALPTSVGGGYAAIVDLPNGERAPYRWNGLTGAQSVWTMLGTLPGSGPGIEESFQFNDIEEWGGRMYAVGHFTWFKDTCWKPEANGIEACALYDLRKNLASYPLDPAADNPKWAPLGALPPTVDLWEDDLVYDATFFKVSTGSLAGLYLAGDPLVQYDNHSNHTHCGTRGYGEGCGANTTIIRLIPFKLLGADFEPNTGIRVNVVAKGMLALTPNAPPSEVLVAGGKFNIGGRFGLAAWNGASWNPVATGISQPQDGCLNQICSTYLPTEVMGLAFLDTDLYVSGNFTNVPAGANEIPDAANPSVPCQAELPLSNCHTMNGFARVQNARWQPLKDPSLPITGFSVPFAPANPVPRTHRLFAEPVSKAVYVLGDLAGGLLPDQLALPYGTPSPFGIFRWRNNKFETLQGGTSCESAPDCTPTVYDAVQLTAGGMLIAGQFTQVGRVGSMGPIEAKASFKLARYFPTRECPADFNNNGAVDGADLALLLSSWGVAAAGGTAGDIDSDGMVGGSDLATLLSAWGPCAL